ncbi:MAG: hypothetical protein ACRDL7_10045 [Gaiellaceae bacterium]
MLGQKVLMTRCAKDGAFIEQPVTRLFDQDEYDEEGPMGDMRKRKKSQPSHCMIVSDPSAGAFIEQPVTQLFDEDEYDEEGPKGDMRKRK